MKISQNAISIIGVFVILVLFFISNPIKTWKNHDLYKDGYTLEETKFTRINDEIKAAKSKLESLTFKKKEEVNENFSYSGWTFDKFGIGKLHNKGMYFPDTVTYLQLACIGVGINEDIGNSYLFYYEKDRKGYLSRTKWVGNYKETTIVTDDNGKEISRTGNTVSFVDKKVDYNYSYANRSMLIPLKSKFSEIVIATMIWAFAFLQFALYVIIIVLFFRFLMYIARNNAFAEENIQRLNYMSIAFFILAVNKYLIFGIIYLLFISIYSSDGVVMNYSFWENDYLMLILAILCYLIYTAFKRGMSLQQENELTI